MCTALEADALDVDPLLEALTQLGWVGLLQEEHGPSREGRWVLLIEPASTPLEPLIDRLLIARVPLTEGFWHSALLAETTLQQALGGPEPQAA
jgi:membrane protein